MVTGHQVDKAFAEAHGGQKVVHLIARLRTNRDANR